MRAIATNLAGRRGASLLFSGIGFSLARGEALVITGPNGAGKSTLLRVLAGLLVADSGHFALYGDHGYGSAGIGACAHYLGHRNAMKRELQGVRKPRILEALPGPGNRRRSFRRCSRSRQVGLTGVAHLPFGYLSAGQQRRIALARLLVSARPLWLLDEPTAALDRRSDQLFADLVHAHLAKGGMAIAATHQPLGLETVQTLELSGVHGAVPDGHEAWA
jgi:heme exporter protein A